MAIRCILVNLNIVLKPIFFSLGRLITIKGIVYHFQVETDHNLLVQYLNKHNEWNVFDAGIDNVSKSLVEGVAYIQSNCPTSENSFCNG